MCVRSLAILALLAGASPVLAQDAGDDWDFTRDQDRKLVAASTTFSNGLSIAVRCIDGRYDALIGGLPPVDGEETRRISLQFGDKEAKERSWYVGNNASVAVSELPARLARDLRDGGRLQIRLEDPSDAERRLRYDVELPSSSAFVDQTLQACDRDLMDPRDALIDELGDNGLPPKFEWVNRPRPEYPSGDTFTRGFAVLSCLTRSDGGVRDCVVESENPVGGGFAEAALRGSRNARVRNTADPDTPTPSRMIVFSVNFRMRSGTR